MNIPQQQQIALIKNLVSGMKLNQIEIKDIQTAALRLNRSTEFNIPVKKLIKIVNETWSETK